MKSLKKWPTSLVGKTVIVTGANSGIGYPTTLDMAHRGARVIMACRSLEKANEACEEIKREIDQLYQDNVVVMQLNLSSFKSVREFARKFLDQEKRLDILINNAGCWLDKRTLTEDGFETTFQANHLGHFLLTNLLLDKLKACAPSRIVNVSSMAHAQSSNGITFDDLNREKKYDGFKVYGDSKLMNIMFTNELARRLQGTGVTVYSLHPGVVKTNFFRTADDMCCCVPCLLKCFSCFLKSPDDGAMTTIYCAVSEDLNENSGNYFSGCKQVNLKAFAKNEEHDKRLWELSANNVGL